MDLISLLKEEGYTKVSYIMDGEKHSKFLNQEMDADSLMKLFMKNTHMIEYFPYEAKPYLMVLQPTTSIKVLLYK
ncbi:hypothetical protein LCM20_06440 [Halobacillus litoralis]|uniref:hypothetical protein n=1 Tax=Halobacillus litoralis TaxID=45668 RepID=UPI001CD46771|nr:hypothetical protein [Halobacillus litoralis]MCA0970219.1 hypothetical protein [Halobacillus litoralis]